MVEIETARTAGFPVYGVEVCTVCVFLTTPTVAASVENVVADESVLHRVTLDIWQIAIAFARGVFAAVGECVDRCPKKCDIARGSLRSPHLFTVAFRTDKDIQML